MFIGALFLSVWPSDPLRRGGFGTTGSLPLTTPLSSLDTAELLRLRQANAVLTAEKDQLHDQLKHLRVSLNSASQDRSQLAVQIGSISAERAKFEEQARQLRETLESQRVGASKPATEMGRRSSSASTASPPSSLMQDMVSKAQLEVAQALSRRMEELASDAERRLQEAKEKIAELEGRLVLPAVEEQKRKWQEKTRDLERLIGPLETINPPPHVPKLNLTAVARRESLNVGADQDHAHDVLNSSFNGFFAQGKRVSFGQRQLPYRRGSSVGKRVPGTDPLYEARVTSADASPKDQSLSLFPIFDDEAERHPQWEGPEEWVKALKALKAYLEKVRETESSDDDFSHNTAASTSAVVSAVPETEAVAKLKEDLRALSTAKDQMAVSFDASTKEKIRMTNMCVQFSREIGLDENYRPSSTAEDNSLVKTLAKLGLDVYRATTINGGLGVGTRRLLDHLNRQLLPLEGEALIASNGTLNIVSKKVKSNGWCCS